MKLKLLLNSTLSIGLVFSAIAASAQQRDGVINHDLTAPVVQQTHEIRDDGKTFSTVPTQNHPGNIALLPIGCDTLWGSDTANNGNSGIVFNVVPLQPTRIDFMNSWLDGPGSGYIRLYSRSESFIGYQNSDAGWMLIDSVFMNVPVSGFYRIPIHINQFLTFHDTTAYYLTVSYGATFGVGYTNGTALDTVYSSTTALQLREGQGMAFPPFTTSAIPRVFTGTIEHCPYNTNACESFTTTFAGGNGANGNIFNISTNHDIMIKNFYGSVVDSGYMYLYYRYGSYAGHQATPGDWVLADSSFIVSAAAGVPTLLFSNVNIELGEGETMAFYISTGASGSVDYTDGTAEGNLYANDGVVKFYEGLGMGYPDFGTSFSPRIWNGILDYCIVPGFIGIEDNTNPQDQILVYPVPTTGTLFMDFRGKSGDREVIITDMAGRMCRKLNNIQTDILNINLEDFSNGIYLYSIYNKGQKEGSGKFIKQ